MQTVRDIVEQAALKSNAVGSASSISGNEASDYLRLLNFVVNGLAMKKLMNPKLKQINIPVVNNKVVFIRANSDFFKDMDETTKGIYLKDENVLSEDIGIWWEGLTAAQKELYRDWESSVVVPFPIMKPSSVLFSYPGWQDAFVPMDGPWRVPTITDSLYYPGEFVDPEIFLFYQGTLGGDVQYPRYWTWQSGDKPEITIMSRIIKTMNIRVNTGFDQFHNLELNSDISEWADGLDYLCTCMLAAEIAQIQGYDATFLRHQANRVLNDYCSAHRPAPTMRLDASVPTGGGNSGPYGGYGVIARVGVL
jgi:hypothetical protein